MAEGFAERQSQGQHSGTQENQSPCTRMLVLISYMIWLLPRSFRKLFRNALDNPHSRHSSRRAGLQWRCWRIAGWLSVLCQLAGGFDFRLASNSSHSLGVIIFTLAMCGSRERYGESSFGGGGTLPAEAVVGAGVAGVGFAATTGTL
jgi:hypothetical protein